MVTRGLLKKENGEGVWFKKDLGPYIDWYKSSPSAYLFALRRRSSVIGVSLLKDEPFTVVIPWEFM